MAGAKRILVICGMGVATSMMVVQKIRAFCESDGLSATITHGEVADLVSGRADADFIVAATQVPSSVTIPVIAGLPFLTGIGVEAVYDQIRAQFE
ncbi:MAG: PTS sugar transporter subunit IIB [Micropruina sp.]|nr:PTS sugar transporter subunit IIB [Micropruina sp.]